MGFIGFQAPFKGAEESRYLGEQLGQGIVGFAKGMYQLSREKKLRDALKRKPQTRTLQGKVEDPRAGEAEYGTGEEFFHLGAAPESYTDQQVRAESTIDNHDQAYGDLSPVLNPNFRGTGYRPEDTPLPQVGPEPQADGTMQATFTPAGNAYDRPATAPADTPADPDRPDLHRMLRMPDTTDTLPLGDADQRYNALVDALDLGSLSKVAAVELDPTLKWVTPGESGAVGVTATGQPRAAIAGVPKAGREAQQWEVEKNAKGQLLRVNKVTGETQTVDDTIADPKPNQAAYQQAQREYPVEHPKFYPTFVQRFKELQSAYEQTRGSYFTGHLKGPNGEIVRFPHRGGPPEIWDGTRWRVYSGGVFPGGQATPQTTPAAGAQQGPAPLAYPPLSNPSDEYSLRESFATNVKSMASEAHAILKRRPDLVGFLRGPASRMALEYGGPEFASQLMAHFAQSGGKLDADAIRFYTLTDQLYKQVYFESGKQTALAEFGRALSRWLPAVGKHAAVNDVRFDELIKQTDRLMQTYERAQRRSGRAFRDNAAPAQPGTTITLDEFLRE